jgi:hemolysin activation/secretion protein
VLLADDLPGVAASANLMEGARPGQTDLLLLLLNGQPLVSGEATLDNAGNRSTGLTRLSVNLQLNSPFKIGDLIGANLIEAEGSHFVRVAASVPVGSDGWRVGVNASSLRYNVVLSDFAALDMKGASDSVGLEAIYPVVRARRRNLYVQAALDQRSFDNQAGGATSSRYRSDNLTLGLWGNSLDGWGGGGSSTASLSWTGGALNLDGSPNQGADAASSHTEGSFNKLRYGLARQQTLGNNTLLVASLSGQWADRNLDSSEKFYLGGAGGVRAFPSNEAGGANGQLLNLELRQRLPKGFTLSAFSDSGQVSGNVDNHYPGAPASNETFLQGYGLGLDWQHASGLNLGAAWSHRTGNHPNPGPGGRDLDGSQVMDRWWLTARLPF